MKCSSMIKCNKSNLKRNVKKVVYDLKSLQNKAEQKQGKNQTKEHNQHF